jgi:bacteriorhodopsin
MTTDTNTLGQSKSILSILLAAAVILMVPLVAMQFTDHVNWGWFDFAAAGALLSASGLVFLLATRWARDIDHKVAIGAVVAVALLIVWVELAAGIFGTSAAGS